MGSIGNFLFGGSKDTQNSNQSSNSTTSSQNQAQNQSSQGSISTSNQASNAVSDNRNLAYPSVAGAMTPTLGYTSGAGNMIASLLGLPGYTPSSTPAPAAPVSVPAPAHLPSGGSGSGSGNGLSQLIDLVKGMVNTPAPSTPTTPIPGTPVPPVTTPPVTTPPVIHPPTVPPSLGGIGNLQAGGGQHGGGMGHTGSLLMRALGGPVQAGQGYVVGEKQPEVFVPHVPGHIEPAAPGMPPQHGRPNITALFGHPSPVVPTPPIMAPGQVPAVPVASTAPVPTTPAVQPQSALTDWSNSAGMNFLRDQGTQAIANTGAASGTFQSGATGKALEKFGVGLGSTYQNDYINHLLDLAKLGLGGASSMSGAGGVGTSQSNSTGGSSSVSMGNSSGTSSGTSSGVSSSTGVSAGDANSKKGLVPDILG